MGDEEDFLVWSCFAFDFCCYDVEFAWERSCVYDGFQYHLFLPAQ